MVSSQKSFLGAKARFLRIFEHAFLTKITYDMYLRNNHFQKLRSKVFMYLPSFVAYDILSYETYIRNNKVRMKVE